MKKVLETFLALVTFACLFFVAIFIFQHKPHTQHTHHIHHTQHNPSEVHQHDRHASRNFDNFVRIAFQPVQTDSGNQHSANGNAPQKGREAAWAASRRPTSSEVHLPDGAHKPNSDKNRGGKSDARKDKDELKPASSTAGPDKDGPSATGTTRSSAARVDRNFVLSESERGRLRKSGRQKYVIFLCDGRRSCGGWGDRQRGLVGTFLLALVTGRRFGLNMSVPCEVSNFYRPSQYNWVVPESELVNKTSIVLDDVNSVLKLTGRLLKMDFNAEYPQDVVFIRNNAEYWLGIRINPRYSGKMPIWARGSRAQYFGEGWKTLMAPQPSLQGRLDGFLQKMDFSHRTQPLVCSHVRVGRSASGIKTDTEVRANISHLPVLWDFVDQWVKNGSYFFVASDTLEVRTIAHQRFGEQAIDSGGEIIHIDQGKQLPNACRGFESALLDQHILSLCDVLVTSHSIFGQRASYIRGRNEDLYSFLKGKVTKINMNG